MVTDSIGDYITKIRNASISGKEMVVVPFSNLKFAITDLLEKEGYVKNLSKKNKKGRFIEIGIVYENGEPKLRGVERVSKPSKRIYGGSHAVPSVKNGYGHAVLTTSKGVLTDKEARKEKVGGEILFRIW